jgi:hypothetical protein
MSTFCDEKLNALEALDTLLDAAEEEGRELLAAEEDALLAAVQMPSVSPWA